MYITNLWIGVQVARLD